MTKKHEKNQKNDTTTPATATARAGGQEQDAPPSPESADAPGADECPAAAGDDAGAHAEQSTGAPPAEDGAGGGSPDDEPERLYTTPEVEALLAEAQERYLRLLAEYDNFRRRTTREKEQWIADALEGFVKDLLPVFDSFEKARESAAGTAEEGGASPGAGVAAMREGLDVTRKQLDGVLSKYDIEVIDPVGEAFDPAHHEALMRQPSPEHAPGTVVAVFERGYRLGSRLLRPARAIVAAEEG